MTYKPLFALSPLKEQSGARMLPVHFIEPPPFDIEELLADLSITHEALEAAVAHSPEATVFEIIAFTANDEGVHMMGPVALVTVVKNRVDEQKGRCLLKLSNGMLAFFSTLD